MLRDAIAIAMAFSLLIRRVAVAKIEVQADSSA